MLFNSFPFIFLFFPAVLLIALHLKGRALLRWISLSSIVFYAAAGEFWFILPMLATTLLDYFLVPRMARAEKQSTKNLLLVLSLIGNLGLLFYFKYAAFAVGVAKSIATVFGGSPAGLERLASLTRIALPAGISFYTFQTMSYSIDVYRGDAKPELDPWKFTSFVWFFPHLVAGPMTRTHQLMPALARVGATGVRPRYTAGLCLFSLGLAKKVLLADLIAGHVVAPILESPPLFGFFGAWLALIGYSLQIYFDFSGYSDMAIGLGRLFGIELPQNFNSPYQAVNPSDFWKRWHMTLSTWLRDYLYIPLGGNRCTPLRQSVNLLVTMLLGGLWHGANATFLVWGGYHGMLLILFQWSERAWSRRPAWIQRAVTFLAVTIGWVFFRSPSLRQAGEWLSQLVWGARAPLAPRALPFVPLVAAGLLLVSLAPNASSYSGYERLSARHQVAIGLAAAMAVLMINVSSRFLYFQF